MRKYIKSGFTLIELLTVVAIIGILVTVVTVNGFKARSKSRVNAAKIDVSAMLVAYENYKASHLSLPATIADADIINSGSGWDDISFWNTIDPGNAYNPPSGSGITYSAKTVGGKGIFCAYNGDLGVKYLIGKSGNVFEGGSSDCSI